MRRPSVSILAATLFLSGCSGPLAPDRSTSVLERDAARAASSPRLFYPLDLGNHWRFHRVFTLGSGASAVVRRSSIDHDLVCVETIEGREYVIDRLTQVDSTESGNNTYLQWVRNRQDPTGLYEADIGIGEVPACAGTPEPTNPLADDMAIVETWRSGMAISMDAGSIDRAAEEMTRRLRLVRELLSGRPTGGAGNEITRLRYPMTVGRTWTVREDPFFSSTVEALEQLDIPDGKLPAYRVRTDSAFLGPNDRVLAWYSRSGMVGIFVHIEIPVGTGILLAEDVITLEGITIDRGRF